MAAKPKLHEIASTARVDSRVALQVLKEMGEYVKGPSSSLEPPVAQKLVAALQARGYPDADGELHRNGRVVTPGLEIIGTSLRRVDAINLLELVEALPRSLPRLARLVADSWSVTTRRAAELLQGALGDGYFAYSGALEDRKPDESRELPRNSGVMLVRMTSERWRLIFWSTSEEHTITISRCEILVRERVSDRPRRAGTTPVESEVLAVQDGIVLAGDAGESQLFAELRSVCGMRAMSKGRGSKEQGSFHVAQGSSRPGDTASDVEGISVVYLDPNSRVLQHEGSRSTSPRSARWNVRGHWRNQWYPSENGHRRVWIAEHEAGASGVAVRSRDVVYVARADPRPARSMPSPPTRSSSD